MTKKAGTKKAVKTPAKTARQTQASARNAKAYQAAASEVFPKILPPAPGTPDTHDNEWTEKLGKELRTLITMGVSLRKISWMERMPQYPVLLEWAADEDHPFYKVYAGARRLRVIALEEEIEEIADTPEPTKRTTKRTVLDRWGESTVEEETEYDDVRHRQIRISVRQFALGHLSPKKHGKNPEPADAHGAPEAVKELLAAFTKAPDR
jgi:hypothetical protein